MGLDFRKFRSYRQINMKQKLFKNLVVSQKTLIFAELNIEVMARLTLQVDSPSLLEQLKNVLSLMRGVKIVSDSPVSRSAALEDVPNAETLAAMKEAESGHDAGVVRVDSLESFMASMEE